MKYKMVKNIKYYLKLRQQPFSSSKPKADTFNLTCFWGFKVNVTPKPVNCLMKAERSWVRMLISALCTRLHNSPRSLPIKGVLHSALKLGPWRPRTSRLFCLEAAGVILSNKGDWKHSCLVIQEQLSSRSVKCELTREFVLVGVFTLPEHPKVSLPIYGYFLRTDKWSKQRGAGGPDHTALNALSCACIDSVSGNDGGGGKTTYCTQCHTYHNALFLRRQCVCLAQYAVIPVLPAKSWQYDFCSSRACNQTESSFSNHWSCSLTFCCPLGVVPVANKGQTCHFLTHILLHEYSINQEMLLTNLANVPKLLRDGTGEGSEKTLNGFKSQTSHSLSKQYQI